jgi:hypothetical protein
MPIYRMENTRKSIYLIIPEIRIRGYDRLYLAHKNISEYDIVV